MMVTHAAIAYLDIRSDHASDFWILGFHCPLGGAGASFRPVWLGALFSEWIDDATAGW